jgi:type II secretory pathway component GspD/PulD (secretin)
LPSCAANSISKSNLQLLVSLIFQKKKRLLHTEETMNSLHKLSVCAKHLAFALMIVFCLTALVSAQRVAPSAAAAGKNVRRSRISRRADQLNVVNADIRDILNYITEQYGINFVIDKSVEKVPVTVNVSEVPWNIALDSILQAQELGVQVNGSILRVAQAKNLAAKAKFAGSVRKINSIRRRSTRNSFVSITLSATAV